MDGHIRFSPYKSADADADANFTEIADADADADMRFIITADADVKKTADVSHLRMRMRISDTSLEYALCSNLKVVLDVRRLRRQLTAECR